ncbi:hypothetical protein PAXINDRAFT_19355 [Paxillus involutus ATCC 200175]|uniref:DUF6532 domain-containing protein n=1 Tax=Paxillus involutus ATCC 200175 TaxID=664439 RepID=A0A0C9SN80_PAXIN|nr:hypothetical protein PAXINDRAFT_19355 [Paxillus involutus ATCC 200175]
MSASSTEENLANAQQLICGAVYLRDGIDEDGSTRNMASPALAGLIIEFFYTGSSAVGVLFPEVFGREVPKATVALAGTALRGAIDEYATTGVRQDRHFEYTWYSKVFTHLMLMQAMIDTNPKHAAKTQALRIAWATTGSEALNHSGNMVAFEDDFEVILN